MPFVEWVVNEFPYQDQWPNLKYDRQRPKLRGILNMEFEVSQREQNIRQPADQCLFLSPEAEAALFHATRLLEKSGKSKTVETVLSNTLSLAGIAARAVIASFLSPKLLDTEEGSIVRSLVSSPIALGIETLKEYEDDENYQRQLLLARAAVYRLTLEVFTRSPSLAAFITRTHGESLPLMSIDAIRDSVSLFSRILKMYPYSLKKSSCGVTPLLAGLASSSATAGLPFLLSLAESFPESTSRGIGLRLLLHHLFVSPEHREHVLSALFDSPAYPDLLLALSPLFERAVDKIQDLMWFSLMSDLLSRILLLPPDRLASAWMEGGDPSILLESLSLPYHYYFSLDIIKCIALMWESSPTFSENFRKRNPEFFKCEYSIFSDGVPEPSILPYLNIFAFGSRAPVYGTLDSSCLLIGHEITKGSIIHNQLFSGVSNVSDTPDRLLRLNNPLFEKVALKYLKSGKTRGELAKLYEKYVIEFPTFLTLNQLLEPGNASWREYSLGLLGKIREIPSEPKSFVNIRNRDRIVFSDIDVSGGLTVYCKLMPDEFTQESRLFSAATKLAESIDCIINPDGFKFLSIDSEGKVTDTKFKATIPQRVWVEIIVSVTSKEINVFLDGVSLGKKPGIKIFPDSEATVTFANVVEQSDISYDATLTCLVSGVKLFSPPLSLSKPLSDEVPLFEFDANLVHSKFAPNKSNASLSSCKVYAEGCIKKFPVNTRLLGNGTFLRNLETSESLLNALRLLPRAGCKSDIAIELEMIPAHLYTIECVPLLKPLWNGKECRLFLFNSVYWENTSILKETADLLFNLLSEGSYEEIEEIPIAPLFSTLHRISGKGIGKVIARRLEMVRGDGDVYSAEEFFSNYPGNPGVSEFLGALFGLPENLEPCLSFLSELSHEASIRVFNEILNLPSLQTLSIEKLSEMTTIAINKNIPSVYVDVLLSAVTFQNPDNITSLFNMMRDHTDLFDLSEFLYAWLPSIAGKGKAGIELTATILSAIPSQIGPFCASWRACGGSEEELGEIILESLKTLDTANVEILTAVSYYLYSLPVSSFERLNIKFDNLTSTEITYLVKEGKVAASTSCALGCLIGEPRIKNQEISRTLVSLFQNSNVKLTTSGPVTHMQLLSMIASSIFPESLHFFENYPIETFDEVSLSIIYMAILTFSEKTDLIKRLETLLKEKVTENQSILEFAASLDRQFTSSLLEFIEVSGNESYDLLSDTSFISPPPLPPLSLTPSQSIFDSVPRYFLSSSMMPFCLFVPGIHTNKPFELFSIDQLYSQWVERRVSSYEFIMKLNILNGRSFEDTNNYPVFPRLPFEQRKRLPSKYVDSLLNQYDTPFPPDTFDLCPEFYSVCLDWEIPLPEGIYDRKQFLDDMYRSLEILRNDVVRWANYTFSLSLPEIDNIIESETQFRKLFKISGTQRLLSFSHDILYTLGIDGTISVFPEAAAFDRPNDTRALREYKLPLDLPDPQHINDVSLLKTSLFVNNLHFAVYAPYMGKVHLYALNEQNPIKITSLHVEGFVSALGFASPEILVAACRLGSISWKDIMTGEGFSFDLPFGEVTAMAIFFEDRILVCISETGETYVSGLYGNKISSFRIRPGVRFAKVLPNGTFCCSFDDGIEIWSIMGKLLSQWDSSVASIVTVSTCTSRIFSAFSNGKGVILNCGGASKEISTSKPIADAAYSNETRTLVVVDNHGVLHSMQLE